VKIAQNLKQMQTIGVHTTQNVTIQYPLASIGDRILAYILDVIILIIYSAAVIALFINISLEVWWIWVVALAMPFLLYGVLSEILMNGKTLGKHVMKIQVVRIDGTPATIGNYLLRWLFAIIDFQMSGLIAVITIAASGKGQRLGDMVAGTCVVKMVQQNEITANEIFVSTNEQSYSPTFAQVVMLTDQDVELVQQALEVNRLHGNIQPAIAIAEKIKMLLGIDSALEPVKFLHTIVSDYSHLTTR
jgi:uncharacterized RDD family membrane protein YckC